MILFIANNDLDLLALRVAVEGLPADFVPVRAHGGIGLDRSDELPDLDGVRVVLVRLFRGRAAWTEPFDELPPALCGAGHRRCSPSAASPPWTPS